jgi:hypothetical protein
MKNGSFLAPFRGPIRPHFLRLRNDQLQPQK